MGPDRCGAACATVRQTSIPRRRIWKPGHVHSVILPLTDPDLLSSRVSDHEHRPHQRLGLFYCPVSSLSTLASYAHDCSARIVSKLSSRKRRCVEHRYLCKPPTGLQPLNFRSSYGCAVLLPSLSLGLHDLRPRSRINGLERKTNMDASCAHSPPSSQLNRLIARRFWQSGYLFLLTSWSSEALSTNLWSRLGRGGLTSGLASILAERTVYPIYQVQSDAFDYCSAVPRKGHQTQVLLDPLSELILINS